jgi:hypothetical protein
MLIAILIGGAILALALGLNPLTFQKFGAEPEATPAALATPVVAANTPAARATVAPAGVAAPAVAPTAIPTPVATAPAAVQTAAPAATPVARAEQSESAATTTVSEPTVQAAEPTAVSNEQAEPTPVQATVPSDLAAAIIQGYDNYWSVRVRAMGDPSDSSIDLESVMANEELAAARQTLGEYRDDGEAYQATIHHQIWITQANPGAAEIVDQFTATTLKLDPGTKQPVETTAQVEHITGRFLLQPIGGVWKVVGRAQED